MAGSLQTQPVETNSETVAMLGIAWEMTKLIVHLDAHAVEPDKLREEFTKNIDTVYNAWQNRGDGTADQALTVQSPFS
jgi:hypothetical protein